MMMDLPDAPWIVDAERNGYPHAEPVKCPVCGKECETIYTDRFMDDVVGCDMCIARKDAHDWAEENESEDEEE